LMALPAEGEENELEKQEVNAEKFMKKTE